MLFSGRLIAGSTLAASAIFACGGGAPTDVSPEPDAAGRAQPDAAGVDGAGPLSGASSISSSGDMSCAVTRGSVQCWGATDVGELGNGSVDGTPTPVEVTGVTGASTVSVGPGSACVLLPGGAVQCWGDAAFGELGDAPAGGFETCAAGQACSTTPVAIPGVTGATAVSVGGNLACAVVSGGAVQCWGNATLGDTGWMGATAVSVSAEGGGAVCALMTGGTVQCLGDNFRGELGNGSTLPSTAGTPPVAVTGLTGATAISVGDEFACAVVTGGAVQCWGDNSVGELGTGTSAGPEMCNGSSCSTTPVTVNGVTGAIAVSAGTNSACAVIAGGSVLCWGDDSLGQLGNGDTTAATTPVAVTGVTGASAVSVGDGFACAIVSGGTVECWGDDSFEELGNGPPNLNGPMTAVAVQ